MEEHSSLPLPDSSLPLPASSLSASSLSDSFRYVTLESHRERVVERVDAEGKETQIPFVTPDQIFAEMLQKIDFSKTYEEQEVKKKSQEASAVPVRTKNPLALLNQAFGELEQSATLLGHLLEGQQIALQQLSKNSTPKDKRLIEGHKKRMQRKEALQDASKRLHVYAKFATDRKKMTDKRLEEAQELRKQWKLQKVKKFRIGEIRNWFAIDYSFQPCGSSTPGTIIVSQTPTKTAIKLSDQSLNRKLFFSLRTEKMDKEGRTTIQEIQFCPTGERLPIGSDIEGVEEISKVLEQAQYSLLCSDAFRALSHDARNQKDFYRKISSREQEIMFHTRSKDSLSVHISSQEQTSSPSHSSDDIHSRFFMNLIHISLLKLLSFKYREEYALRQYKTGINKSGIPVPGRSTLPFVSVCLLENMWKLIGHLLFRQKITAMLYTLRIRPNGLFGSTKGYDAFSPLRFRWLACRNAFVSFVDVALGPGYPCKLSLFGTSVLLEQTGQSFTDVDSLKEFLLIYFCRNTISHMYKEMCAQKIKAKHSHYSAVIFSLPNNPDYSLEITVKPHDEHVVDANVILTQKGNATQQSQTLPLHCIPGDSYSAKLYYCINQTSLQWFMHLVALQ